MTRSIKEVKDSAAKYAEAMKVKPRQELAVLERDMTMQLHRAELSKLADVLGKAPQGTMPKRYERLESTTS